MAAIIVLFTDFGLAGPYTGQVKTVLHQIAPGVPVIDLFADLPAAKPQPAAYLLAASGRVRARRRTFSEVPEGEAFWYENSSGLAEIAVNAGRADTALGLAIGAPVAILP